MSLYSALRAGVSGLNAQTQAMSMISENISNVNTTGYKAVRAKFSSLVGSGESQSAFSAGVVSSIAHRAAGTSGQITFSEINTHMAVSGSGYFAVANAENVVQDSSGQWSNTGEVLYTRVGDFAADSNGNLKNSAGHILLGWKRNDTNSGYEQTNLMSELAVINVAGNVGQPKPTQRIDLSANLNADMVEGESSYITAPMYSRQGGISNIEYRFTKIPNGSGSTATSRRFLIEARVSGGTAQLMNPNAVDVSATTGVGERFVDGEPTPVKFHGAQLGSSRREFVLNFGGPVELNVNDTTHSIGNLRVLYTLDGIVNELTAENVEIVGGKVTLRMNEILPVEATDLQIAIDGPSPLSYALDPRSSPPITDGSVDGISSTLDDRAITIPDTAGTDITTHYQLGILSFDSNGGNPTVQEFVGSDLGLVTQRAGSISVDDVLSVVVDHAADGESASPFNSDDVSVIMNFAPVAGTAGMTSYQSLSTIYTVTQDGSVSGNLEQVSVNNQGEVQAIFNRGAPSFLSQVVLVNFADPSALIAVDGGAYRASDSSGSPNTRAPGTGDTGTVSGGSLEASTADVATEFTEMIIVQRAYSASTKIITTADEMLEDIIRAKR